jgi:Ser/Thr protein kinase RdoA (MazF antagonist)
MAVDGKIERILRLYPDECRPHHVEPFAAADSFSGAGLWRLETDRGPLCLRQWPAQHPSQERLEFIQAVLWHVDQEGFHRIALPLETRHHHGYVWHEGHLWELTPWLPGAASYRQTPSAAKLHNALVTLAEFHRAAATFPLPETGPVGSPGIIRRHLRLQHLLTEGLQELLAALAQGGWPELEARAGKLVSLFAAVAPKVLPALRSAADLAVTLQPCIRDVWQPHVLFVDDRVTGIVDFGSMRPENVAGDVARLLGSLAGDKSIDWERGLAAYQSVRRLTSDELVLISTFDRSTVLMGGLQWLEWIYLERREFANRQAVLSRIDEFVSRLETLSQVIG